MRVRYLAEYYTQDPWSYKYLTTLGIARIDKTLPAGAKADRPAHSRNSIHVDIDHEAQIAVQDPNLIRARERPKANQFDLHGDALKSVANTVQLDRNPAEYRATITAEAFRRAAKIRTN